MSLDVEPPPPPTLEAVDAGEDGSTYRREELEAHLRAGAWDRAFDRWAETTDLPADTYAIARELGLFERFDFFWDEFAERVGYNAPGIPEDWQAANYHDELESWGQVSGINAALAEFGQIVCDVLVEEYLDAESSDDA